MICELKKIKSACDYAPEGVDLILVIPKANIVSLEFDRPFVISKIYKKSEFAELETSQDAKLTTDRNGRDFVSTIETFVSILDGDVAGALLIAELHKLAIIFRTRSGRYYYIGDRRGASLTFKAQTSPQGFAVSLKDLSRFPLCEVLPEAVDDSAHRATFNFDFINGATCEIV